MERKYRKDEVTSPEETTTSKVGEVGPIPKPNNVIEFAINKLREWKQLKK